MAGMWTKAKIDAEDAAERARAGAVEVTAPTETLVPPVVCEGPDCTTGPGTQLEAWNGGPALCSRCRSLPITDLVKLDIDARARLGTERYGGPIDIDDGRDWLLEAFEEALDMVIYLRAAIELRDRP